MKIVRGLVEIAHGVPPCGIHPPLGVWGAKGHRDILNELEYPGQRLIGGLGLGEVVQEVAGPHETVHAFDIAGRRQLSTEGRVARQVGQLLVEQGRVRHDPKLVTVMNNQLAVVGFDDGGVPRRVFDGEVRTELEPPNIWGEQSIIVQAGDGLGDRSVVIQHILCPQRVAEAGAIVGSRPGHIIEIEQVRGKTVFVQAIGGASTPHRGAHTGVLRLPAQRMRLPHGSALQPARQKPQFRFVRDAPVHATTDDVGHAIVIRKNASAHGDLP